MLATRSPICRVRTVTIDLALTLLKASGMTNISSSIHRSHIVTLERVRVDEQMDNPALDATAHHAALAGLRRLNAWSRSWHILWSKISAAAVQVNALGRPLRVIDVATGSADGPMAMATRARALGLKIDWTLCDCSTRALDVAAQTAAKAGQRVSLSIADVLHTALPVRGDVVTCSLFLHHLDPDTACIALRNMADAADIAVGAADLNRTRAGLALAWIGSRALTRSSVVHFDAVASARAAFTCAEIMMIAESAGLVGVRVVNAWPSRWQLWWERSGMPTVRAR